MKIFMSVMILGVGFSCIILGQSSSQSPDAFSPQIKFLAERAHRGDTNALLELGDTGDTNAIPILELYVVNHALANSTTRPAASRALIKLGAEKYYDKRIEELKVDARQRAQGNLGNAFKALSCMKTKEAVKVVAKYLLDDTDAPASHGDVGFWPVRMLAADALSQMIPSPPVKKRYEGASETDVQTWRTWWSKNKGKYE